MLDLITRTYWQAQYDRGPRDPGAKPLVVLHHSYRPALDEFTTLRKEFQAVAAIERYHVETRGWAGIAYNFLVAPSGRLYEGRGWGRRGAHAAAANSRSVGICLLMNGNEEEPTDKSIRSVRALIRQGLDAGFIDPGYVLVGHRDVMRDRTCPGDLVYAQLQRFRHDSGKRASSPGDIDESETVDDLADRALDVVAGIAEAGLEALGDRIVDAVAVERPNRHSPAPWPAAGRERRRPRRRPNGPPPSSGH